MSTITFPIETSLEGIVVREFDEADFDQCKFIFSHTQQLYGNRPFYVQAALVTDMKDVRRNYLQITDEDDCLPTSRCEEVAAIKSTDAKRKGSWLVAIDTLNGNKVCGQVAIHPLVVGDKNVHKHYETHLADPKNKENFPYCEGIPSSGVAELRRMAILPEYQARRIGSELLAAFMKVAKEMLGFQIVHLTTLVTMDKAVAFYKRQQFTCDRIEYVRLGMLEEGPNAAPPTVYERSEILGGIDALSAEQILESKQKHPDCDVLFVAHFWKML